MSRGASPAAASSSPHRVSPAWPCCNACMQQCPGPGGASLAARLCMQQGPWSCRNACTHACSIAPVRAHTSRKAVSAWREQAACRADPSASQGSLLLHASAEEHGCESSRCQSLLLPVRLSTSSTAPNRTMRASSRAFSMFTTGGCGRNSTIREQQQVSMRISCHVILRHCMQTRSSLLCCHGMPPSRSCPPKSLHASQACGAHQDMQRGREVGLLAEPVATADAALELQAVIRERLSGNDDTVKPPQGMPVLKLKHATSNASLFRQVAVGSSRRVYGWHS